jgi:hypothetical protein
MKLAICFCIISSCIFGQSNFTVFNNNGQAFYVILNGVKQNSLPQTNVVVSGLVNSAYSVKLIFSDGKTADINKNFFIDSPSDITTRIIFKKGKGKLQLISQIPTLGASTGETVINYRPDNNASFSDGSVGIGFIGNSTTTTVVTETTTQQTGNGSVNIQATPTPSNSSNGNVGINVNVNGQTTGGNVNITNTATPANGSAGVQMNIVDSTSGQNMGVNMSININGQVIDPNAQINTNVVVPANVTISGNAPANTNSSTVITTTTTTTNSSNSSINSSNNVVTNTSSPSNSNVNCSRTLNNTAVFIEELKDQSFEDDRVEALQLALVNMCLYAADAEKIMPLFTFDANQLTVAKFMSDRLVDKENASSLAKHFSFDSTKMEYRKYISGKN